MPIWLAMVAWKARSTRGVRKQSSKEAFAAKLCRFCALCSDTQVPFMRYEANPNCWKGV